MTCRRSLGLHGRPRGDAGMTTCRSITVRARNQVRRLSSLGWARNGGRNKHVVYIPACNFPYSIVLPRLARKAGKPLVTTGQRKDCFHGGGSLAGRQPARSFPARRPTNAHSHIVVCLRPSAPFHLQDLVHNCLLASFEEAPSAFSRYGWQPLHLPPRQSVVASGGNHARDLRFNQQDPC